MATVTKTRTYQSGDTLTASNYNDDRDEVISGVNSIVNAQINASAAIALSKLATGALPTDITVASANLVDGTIVNADVNASAAIALSKLATGALPSGITIGDDNVSTTFSYSKVTLTSSIVDGDIAASQDLMIASVGFVIDGGGGVIQTGVAGDLVVPFDCTINSCTLLADQTGSIVVDIWKDVYSSYPPTNDDSITASATPSIASGVKDQDATLTGWTKSISAGDTLRFNVDSCTTITRCTVALKVTKT